jgi:hypothetical protein
MPISIHSVKGRYITYEFTNEVAEVIVETLKAINLLNSVVAYTYMYL